MSETYKEMMSREAIHDKHKEDAKMDSFPPMPKISDTYKEFNKDEFVSMLNKPEVGELDDCECEELGSICDHCEDDV